MYDLVIIGGGPAGAAAAVYAARKQLKSAIIAEEFGGQSTVSSNIYNWIGDLSVSGIDLAKKFEAHVRDYEGAYLDVIVGDKVENIKKTDAGFTVQAEGKSYETKTVLIASGSARRKLDVPGAAKFEHKGLTYCATCDGPLFAGQDVVVIGGGNAGFESAAQLLAYAKSVTLLHRGSTYKADAVTIEKVLSHPNMTGLLNIQTLEVKGDQFVNALHYKDLTTGEEHELPVGGIFVEIGAIPATGFAKGLVEMTKYGQIVTNPRTQRTSVDGIWSAGDCTDGLYHQNNIAAGDAVKALEDIFYWLRTK